MLAIVTVAVCLLSPGLLPVQAQTEISEQPVRIGVQASSGVTRTMETWSATETALNRASEAADLPYRFSIVPETGVSLVDAIQAGRIDMLLSDPASFAVAEVDFDARAILSTARLIDGRSVDQTGALIFARADRPFATLADLSGRDVMAVSHADFSGWWLAAQEFRRFRFEPEQHLGEILFSGGNEREVVYAVQSGLVDAGVIRAGALEELAAQGAVTMSDFRPISLRRFDQFPYWVSTPLYPERVLSALPHVEENALSLVINTLLELNADDPAARQEGGIAWQAPENYQSVHDLLISLRAPPYENYIWQAIVRIHALYRWPIYAVILTIIGSLTFLAYQARRNLILAEKRRNVLRSESRSKVFYRNAIEEHTVFCMLSRDGKISHVNDHFCKLAGKDRHILLGQELSTLLSSRDQDTLGREIQQAMTLKTPWNGHLRLKQTNGTFAWAQCTVIPVTGVEDKLSEIALVATDMTSTQQDVVEETFGDTLELIEDPVIVLDPKSLDLTYCNRAAHATLIEARVGGDWRDRRIADLITRDDLNALRIRAEAVIEGPQRRVTWEVESQKGVSYEISLEYVVPEMDKPSLVVMYRDVTERKVAERAKSEFVSTVSHELRTPLTSMKGALKMASSGLVGEVPDKMKDLLSMANRNTDRLVTLINDILDLEKIEAQKMVYSFEELDLVEVIEQSVEANSFYAQRFNVSLVPQIDAADAPYITMADRNRMMQVMDNLLSNAAKFSHEGGEVTINLFRYRDWIRMSIRDFGTGIPEESQSKIFDKFVQSDSSDTRSQGGTGLGLAIVQPIIAAHKGAISFHSQVNVGTEFFIDLPRVEDGSVSEVIPPESLTVDNFSGTAGADGEATALAGSILVQEFEKLLRRSGWATELEAGRVTTQQILSGSGVLGHAIAINLMDANCRSLMSDLIEYDIIQNAQVYILEATLDRGQGAFIQNDQRGSEVLSDWLKKVPKLMATERHKEIALNVLLIAGADATLSAMDGIEITRVEDAAQAAAMSEQEAYDLVLHLKETPDNCTALILPTSEGGLFDDLPMTIFAGQKAAKDTSMGVVSKFNRSGGGRMRKSS